MKLNLNTLLLILGALGALAPDVASMAGWLAATHISWLIPVVHFLGFLATAFAAVALALPKLRRFLSLLGLATAPGAQAPGVLATGATPQNELSGADAKPSNVVTFPKGPTVLALLVLSAALLLGGTARAQSYGGCFASGRLCAGPSASITVVSFNLADSTFSGGVSPGVGYGLTFTPPSAPWASVGLDLYASVRLGQGQPNQATFSLMGHFAQYVFLGIGPSVTQQPAGVPALVQWSILGGFGVPIDMGAYKARAAEGR